MRLDAAGSPFRSGALGSVSAEWGLVCTGLRLVCLDLAFVSAQTESKPTQLGLVCMETDTKRAQTRLVCVETSLVCVQTKPVSAQT